MLKKILLFFLSANLCIADQQENGRIIKVAKVITVGALGVGAAGLLVIYAPVILPASTVIAIKSAVAAAATKVAVVGASIKTGAVAAAPVATAINIAIPVARAGRPYVYLTKEEKLNELLKRDIAELSDARTEFRNCFMKNKSNSRRNTLSIPSASEEAAFDFALLVGQEEVDKMMDDLSK